MFGDMPSCPAQTHTELVVEWEGGALGTQACALYSADTWRGPSYTTSPEVTTRLSPCQP